MMAEKWIVRSLAGTTLAALLVGAAVAQISPPPMLPSGDPAPTAPTGVAPPPAPLAPPLGVPTPIAPMQRTTDHGPRTTDHGPRTTSDRPAALVNGEVITFAELDSFLQKMPEPASQATESRRREMQREVLDLLIDDHLMQQFLRQQGTKVDESEINRVLQQREQSLKAEGRTIQEFYLEHHLTEAEARREMASMLQWANYVNVHLGNVQLQRYYQDNRDVFDQVTVRASHIVLRLPTEVTAEEKEKALQKLASLRKQIVEGQVAFDEAARKYSQCPSALAGGDLGYFPRKFAWDETFVRAAFALQVGAVSDIVQTEHGMHLIKVTDRKPGTPSVYEKVKEDVRDAAMQEMRQSLLEQQRKASRIEILIEGVPALQSVPSSGTGR